MPHHFLHIVNQDDENRDKVLLYGIRKQQGRRDPIWTFAHMLVPDDPDEIRLRQAELTRMDCQMIGDVSFGDECCYRIEDNVLWCRDRLPEHTPHNEIIPCRPPEHDEADIEHVDGFHLMCECNATWIACHPGEAAGCCPP